MLSRSKTSSNSESVWGTWGATWSFVGYCVAAAALISLIKKGFSIDLYGLPAEIYKQYVTIRDWIFSPLAVLLEQIAIPLPSWVKDAIAIYALPVGAVWRSAKVTAKSDREKFKRDPDGFRQSLHEAAIANMIDPDELIRRVERGIKNSNYRIYRSIRGSLLWPRVIRRAAREILRGEKNARANSFELFNLYLFNFIIIVVVVLSFFGWNHFISLADKSP